MNKLSAPQWRLLFDDWLASGLSSSDFCKNRDLVYDNFLYWRRKFERQESLGKLSPAKQLVPVKKIQTVNDFYDHGLEIRLPNGIVIAGLNEVNIQTVCQLLKQL